MTGTRISYRDEHQRLEGYLAAPDSARNQPGVLVVPSWLNVNESICRRGSIGRRGYAAFELLCRGCGVLELARAGAPVSGVISLHGILTAPIPAQRNAVSASGDADPVASFDQVSGFREEMRSTEVNWEMDIYGGARHSFTGQGVLDQTSPEAALHPQSEARSWQATLAFFS